MTLQPLIQQQRKALQLVTQWDVALCPPVKHEVPTYKIRSLGFLPVSVQALSYSMTCKKTKRKRMCEGLLNASLMTSCSFTTFQGQATPGVPSCACTLLGSAGRAGTLERDLEVPAVQGLGMWNASNIHLVKDNFILSAERCVHKGVVYATCCKLSFGTI